MLRASSPSSIRASRSRFSSASRRVSGVALAATLAVVLSACTADPLSESYLQDGETGYSSAEFTTVEIAPEDRGDPVAFSGVTEAGEEFRSDEVLGQVVVVNFWYAECPPCRVEAEDLESVWQEYKDQGVSFVGVNTRDQAGTAKAFAENYGVTYPSLMDADTGEAKYAFANHAPLQSTPTTLVLDKQGRIAARIIGALQGPSILSTYVREVLAEST